MSDISTLNKELTLLNYWSSFYLVVNIFIIQILPIVFPDTSDFITITPIVRLFSYMVFAQIILIGFSYVTYNKLEKYLELREFLLKYYLWEFIFLVSVCLFYYLKWISLFKMLLVIGIVVYLTIGICGLFYYLIKLVVLKHSERKKIETEKGGEHMRKINWGAVIIIIAFILIIAGLGYITFTNFEFLNTHNGAINLLFAGIVAISTLIYAILTWRLVDETKEMRKAQTDPSISVTIEPREEWISFIDMRIMNIGAGPAYNIKFKIEPDFENFKGNFLSQMKLMQGINYLAQSQKIQFFLTTLTENFAEKIKTPFTIKVTYENKIGATFTENFVIDFSQFEGMAQLGEPPLHKIAKNIENIERDIGHLSTGFHKLQTVVYTKKDIEAEHSERMKQVKKKLKNNRK